VKCSRGMYRVLSVSALALSAIFRCMQTVLWNIDDNRSMKCSRQCWQHVGLTVLAFMPSSGTVSTSLPRIHVH